MNNSQEILTKAIEKAIAGGYTEYNGETSLYRHYGGDWDSVASIMAEGNVHDVEHIIYNHDFAKALWGEDIIEWWGGEERMVKPDDLVIGTPKWQYHLQQMVIVDDPIKYLGENL